MKRLILMSVLLGCLLLCSGCSRTVPDYFAFREAGFCAEVRGTLDGTDFCARITAKRGRDGGEVRVEYLAPAVLERTILRAVCNESGEVIGDAEILRAESDFFVRAEVLNGLFLPATAWLSCDELESVQKNGEGYVLSLANGASLKIGNDGRPTAFSSEKIRMDIVWLESTAS